MGVGAVGKDPQLETPRPGPRSREPEEGRERERDERLRKKHEALKKHKPARDVELEKKKAAIAEALARVQQKKAHSQVVPKNTEQLTPEQIQQIQAADQRRAGSNKHNADAAATKDDS